MPGPWVRPVPGAVERPLERVQEHVAELAGVDELVEAERLRRAVRRLDLRGRAACAASSSSDPARGSSPPRPSRPWSRPGNANTADWPSNGIMPITIEPKPYALRSVTSNFGTSPASARRTCARPCAGWPAFSDALPGQHAGVVGEEHERQVERVGDGDEVRGLVGAVGVDRAGEHLRLVGDDRDRWPPSRQSAQMTTAEVGLHLEARAGVEHDVDHLAHVVDAPAVAGDEVEDLGDGARADVARPRTAGTTTPTTGSSAR